MSLGTCIGHRGARATIHGTPRTLAMDYKTAFNEEYFQDGEKRGTLYKNYLGQVLLHRLYFELAEIIAEVFAPKRVLEVGCAAGGVIYHLNRHFDVEALGIDPSEWAVEHRVHENVRLGAAEDIPFADGEFDLVFSCHALEHLPSEHKDAAFAEMSRVCRGFQFHMHPIVDSGPYVGDTFAHLLNLHKDETHNLLFNRSWWLDHWRRLGWQDTGTRLAVAYDNDGFEMTDCQYILARDTVPAEFFARAANHNLDVARKLFFTLLGKPTPDLAFRLDALKAKP